MDIILVEDLAADLGLDLTDDARAALKVAQTNGLITEQWANPVNPVPMSVQILALTVAGRAYTNRPGRGPVESVTRSFDDSSRTERYAVPAPGSGGAGDVYLTAEELALLNGTTRSRVGAIRLGVPGYTRDW